MLTLEQFRKLYPDWTYLVEPWAGMYEGEPRVISEGFLQFTEETAHLWAGPFPGNCCRFILKDWTHATKSWGPDKGKSILALYQKGKEEQEEKIARGYYEFHKDKHPYSWIDYPSYEKPIALVMYGNDDTSYTKFYATEAEALEELNLFSENEPLNAEDVVFNFGFVFTN
jgi:hypothetical protein